MLCFSKLALSYLFFVIGSGSLAQDVAQDVEMPLVFSADFDDLATDGSPESFDFTDATAWKIEQIAEGKVLSQFKRSDYSPPHRSPFSIGLVKDLEVTDFVLTARVRSTIADYGHRDACIFFGYQDASHFYYIHLGKQTDDHANQVFIVNDAPRTKISTKTTEGTPWDDNWHSVKVVRDAASGKIEVYFDDMEDPVMTATNQEFGQGCLGFGSFDDTTQWDDVRIHGVKTESEDVTTGGKNCAR